MNRKKIFVWMLALVLLVCTACGKEDAAAETTQAAADPNAPLSLTSCTLEASTWSSPNGATVKLTATPSRYTEGDRAAFVVRLEGEEISSAICEWDGSQYTASADLNAADGYCYYVILAEADGTQTEVPVNTPTAPTDEALINLQSALQSYCNILVDSSSYSSGTLKLEEGIVQVQVPQITNNGEAITCQKAELLLKYNGETVDQQEVTLTDSEFPGHFEQSLSGVSFSVPDLEDDQQVTLEAQITLSNGHVLTAPAGTWYSFDGTLQQAVG